MKRVLLSLGLGIMAVAVPLGGRSLAPVLVHPAAMKSTLVVAKAYKHNMQFAHAMASATVTYKGHDATSKLTAENLPVPSTIKQIAYVVWATNGSMKTRAASLMVHGKVASLKATVTMSKVQDIVVTAKHSAVPKHPMGPTVLSGKVGYSLILLLAPIRRVQVGAFPGSYQ